MKSSSADQILDLNNSDGIKIVQGFIKTPQPKELYMKCNTLLPSIVKCPFCIVGNIFRKNRSILTDFHFEEQLFMKMNVH